MAVCVSIARCGRAVGGRIGVQAKPTLLCRPTRTSVSSVGRNATSHIPFRGAQTFHAAMACKHSGMPIDDTSETISDKVLGNIADGVHHYSE